jgi:galactokinase
MNLSIAKKFQELYGKKPIIIAAPGRVNLIGEHTDYNEGFVLPGAIDKKMYLALAPNGTDTINLFANQYQQSFSFSIKDIKPEKDWQWHTYLRGVVYLLQERGCEIKGTDVILDGDVPVGAGMSSSAALCSGFGFGLNELFNFGLSRMDLALIAQKTEHIFAGVMVGIMDMFASLHGKAGHVIKLDCRSMDYEYIPFQFPDYRIVLVNTMVEHSLASSEYNVRRKQCEEGVAIMKKFLKGNVKSLRDIPLKDLEQHKADLSPEVFKRCYYVITENERLLKGCEFLKKGDLNSFGKLMYETHEGLSKLYNVSCKELDFLTNQARTFQQVAGARMMGGGFGGCTINLVKQESVDSFSSFIKVKYESEFQKSPEIYVTQIEDGVKVLVD